LSRQEYVVNPAHRLDQPDDNESASQATGADLGSPLFTLMTRTARSNHAARGRVSEDYEYDDEPNNERDSVNRYAAAYSAVPNETTVRRSYDAPIRHRTMRSRRKMMFVRLVIVATVLSILAFTMSYSLITDVAVASWVCVVSYVALALYAVSRDC